MVPELREIGCLAVVGGVLALDRTAAVQSMTSRPLVGATLVGWILGDPELGLLCGLLLEMLWLMDLPVGNSVPPDETLAGVVIAALAIWAPDTWSREARAALGLLLALPVGFLGRWIDIAVRRWNGNLLRKARLRLQEGKDPHVARTHLMGAVRFFCAGALASASLGAVLGALTRTVTPALPGWVPNALELAEVTVPLVGAASVLAALGGYRHLGLFCGGLVTGGCAAWPEGTGGEQSWWRR